MLHYEMECKAYCNSLLLLLQTDPPEGKVTLFRGKGLIWTRDGARDSLRLSQNQFLDVLAWAEEPGYVLSHIGGLYLENKGRLFIMTGGYTVDTSQMLTLVGGQLLTPKDAARVIKKKDVKFQDKLGVKRKAMLAKFLSDQGYFNDPNKFVNFLTGMQPSDKIAIPNVKERHICYLLFLLHEAGLLKLSFGKGYKAYLEQNICTDSLNSESVQIHNNVNKIKRNKYLKDTIGKDLEAFIRLLKK